jgi:hypothetical protein
MFETEVIIKRYEKNIFFTSLKSLKKGVGSGSISQRYGYGDPDPHQNVTDPKHWFFPRIMQYFGVCREKEDTVQSYSSHCDEYLYIYILSINEYV